MPIFGLAWVASWVGCFFSSSQDLLKVPSYPTYALSIASASFTRSAHNQNHPLVIQEPVALAASVPGAVKGAAGSSQPASDGNRSFASSSSEVVIPARGGLFNFLSYQFAQSALKAGSIFDLPILLQTLKEVLGGKPTPVIPPQAMSIASKRSSRFVFNGQSAKLEPRPDDRCLAKSARPMGGNQPLFGVRFREQLVGKVVNEQQAILISRKLEQALLKPGLEPAQLKPSVLNGQPVVKLGDLPIVALDPKLIQNQHCSSAALATEWVNNLRTALTKFPPTMVEVQERTLGLQETDQTIAGLASWYGPDFHGRQTATGEIFDENELTAAHPSLPFDTYLKVTNLTNGKSVIVRINDRGPYFDNRALDLSREAARYLGSEEAGVIPIEAVIMEPISPGEPTKVAKL